MSFDVGVVEHFTARHHLVGNFGPASEPHGHTYRVEVAARGATLQPDGTLFDITLLQQALRAALATLEGNDLNQLPALAEPNPTAEVVARFLAERVGPALLGARVDAVTVRVWESDEAFAAYTAARS